MAGYLVPPTKSPGDVLTSALWNSYIRDNLDFGMVRPIADNLLTSPAASIDFSAIPATFAHLLLVVRAQSAVAANGDDLFVRLNADAGAHYSYYGNQTNTAATAIVSAYSTANGCNIGTCPGASLSTRYFSTNTLLIPGYADAAHAKHAKGDGGFVTTNTALSWLSSYMNLWDDTSVINELTLRAAGGNLTVGTRATLYGIGGK